MTELENALLEITHFAPSLDSPYDRVRLAEWVRRLTEEDTTLANQYAQLMRIQVRARALRRPFKRPPPARIAPLATCLSREVFAQSPALPTPGPVAPFMCRKSKDGQAYVAVQQIPGKGVQCYLAVSSSTMSDT